MTDLLESVDGVAGLTPDAAPAAGAMLPPPPPPSLDDAGASDSKRVLAVVAAVAIVAATVLGLMWMSANGARDDAEAARASDSAAAEARETELFDQLADATADLDEANENNERLQSELDEALAAVSAAERERDAVGDADGEINELLIRNEALAEQVVELEAALDAVENAAAADEPAAEAEAPAAPAPEPFAIENAPDFARYLGETLSSRTGSSRLNQTQSTCFGTAIINDIGLDALGRGLNLAASASDNNAVVGAMQRAAGTCSIDLSLIF